MAAFNAKDVQALRRATGAGMLDCKRALEETDGDLEKAKQWLREQGKAGATKRSDRDASQGAVALAVSGGAAAIVELRCETDFVAKAESFVNLTDELAQLVAEKGADAAGDKAEAIDDLKTTLKENISVGRVVHFAVGAGSVVGTYLHMQSGRGVNAVLVELQGGSDDLAHDIAVHVAFARPTYLRREDVPAAEVELERPPWRPSRATRGSPKLRSPRSSRAA
jgi:elongation factor Ts